LDELKKAGLTPTATIFNAIMAVMPQRYKTVSLLRALCGATCVLIARRGLNPNTGRQRCSR
jgi:hypothetical protein